MISVQATATPQESNILFGATSVTKPSTRHALSGGKLPDLFVAQLMR